MKMNPEKVMILGGSGLIGYQIARKIARDLGPKIIFIVTLHQSTMREALQGLRKEFPKVTFDGSWGNIFLRSSWREKKRSELLLNRRQTEKLIQDLYIQNPSSGDKNHLARLIRQQKPDVIIDAIPTASKLAAMDDAVRIMEVARTVTSRPPAQSAQKAFALPEKELIKLGQMIIHLSIPQLTRHVQIINDAMHNAETRLYLKVGTTGTGGMGLNIPYTSSEDKPSSLSLARTALAFAHTGLLFSMARTPGAPIIKEIKPAALVGSRQVEYRTIESEGKPQPLYHAKRTILGDTLSLRPDVGYARRGDLAIVGVHTGSTGFLTRGEFEAITTMHQMEYITPEEVAQIVVLEIQGINTGHEMISAVDAAVIGPSYRAGMLRRPILEEMQRLEHETQTHSIALGQLGAPILSKLLCEAWLLKAKYKSLLSILDYSAEELSHTAELYLLHHAIRHTIISIGIPILLSDGQTLLRGPFIKIPQYHGEIELAVNHNAINTWAAKGWVDLRMDNMAKWQQRISRMHESCKNFFDIDSRDLDRGPCPSGSIEIGEIVGWIFNNDPSIEGFRLKST